MAEQGGQEAKIKLGFDYNPKEVEKFVKDMLNIKGELKDTEGKLSGFGDKIKGALGGLKSIATGVISTLSGIFTIKQAGEAENIKRNFVTTFRGLVPEAEKIARELQDKFSFSFDKARLSLIDVFQDIKQLGVSQGRALGASGQILKLSRDLSVEHGIPLEKALEAIKGFAVSGNLDAFTKLLGIDKERLGLALDAEDRKSLTQSPGAAGLFRRLSVVQRGFDKRGITGSAQRDLNLTTLTEGIVNNLEDTISVIGEELLPPLKKFAKSLNSATKDLDVWTKSLIESTKSLALSAYEKIKDFLEKNKVSKTDQKKFLHGILRNILPSAAVDAIFGAEAAGKVDFKSLKEKAGEVDFKSLKEKAGEKFQSFKSSIPFLNKKESPQSAVTNNNNINLTINARTDDPEKLAEMVKPQLQSALDEHFNQRHEREIEAYRSGVIG